MKKGSYLMAFIFGAAAGSLATWRYVKGKYEQIAQEEIDSVKCAFEKREGKIKEEMPEVHEYEKVLDENGYTNYSNRDAGQEKEEDDSMDRPYVIPPEEFGQIESYETISLTYYADMVLADDNDELVEDVDNIVGLDSLGHFGEYEDDSVFVRNDRLKCDYEILLDNRKFTEVRRQ